MSQPIDINLGTSLHGTNFRTECNGIFDALASLHQGTSRPSYAVANMIWCDNSADPVWVLYCFDGTDDIEMGRFNIITNIFTPANSMATDGSSNYGASSTGNDAYSITTGQGFTALTVGQHITFLADVANSGACTLNVDGIAAVPIKKGVNTTLDTADIKANQMVTVRYDGTNFQLQPPLIIKASISDIEAGTDETKTITPKRLFDALFQKGTDIASASTLTIPSTGGGFFSVTGTTGVTGLSTEPAGREIELKFAGILTLTHDGTSFILPGAADITTDVGDIARFRSLGSGNWQCTNYQLANSLSSGGVKLINSIDITTAVSGVVLSGLDLNYDKFELDYWGLTTSIDGSMIHLRVSDDEGVTNQDGASDYLHDHMYPGGQSEDSSDSQIDLGYIGQGNAVNESAEGLLAVRFNGTALHIQGILETTNTSGNLITQAHTSRYLGSAAVNSLYIWPASGNFTAGKFRLRGYKN